ncbi:MAG: helix-turn-helix domain-containing protein [bacterium]
MILNNFIKLFHLIIKLSENKNKKNISEDINEIITYIDRNLNKHFNIKTLAQKINLSDSWFKRKFKNEIGIPPNEYINRKKIDKAKNILRKNKDMSITEMSHILSYSSSEYFSVVFKKFTGQTPTDFKKHNT